MEQSLVSIIVPVYKSEEYLELLLSDLIAQTYDNLEIIVVNDGSPDNSHEIIKIYAKKDNRIRYIQTENQGVSMARNKGLELAEGKYIRFVDADDRVPVNSIQLLVEAMEQDEEVDIVFGVYKDDSKRQLYTGEDNRFSKVSKEAMLQDFVMHVRTFYYGVVWNKLYKREIIRKYGISFPKDIIWCEDFLFNLEYYIRCRSAYYLDKTKIVYVYKEHEGSMTEELRRNDNQDIQKKMDSIDEMRKCKAREILSQYGLERKFDLQWKYMSLYNELLALGKPSKQKKVFERYQEIKVLLRDDGVKEYVELMLHTNSMVSMWKKIYKAIVKERYVVFFVYLSFRGMAATYMSWLKPIWKIVTKKRNPKSFL